MTKVGMDDYLTKHSIDEFHELPVEPIRRPAPTPDAAQPIILHPALDVREKFALFGLRHQRVVGEEVKEGAIVFIATPDGIDFTNRALVDFGDTKGVLNLQGKLLPLAGDRIDLDNMMPWLKNPSSPNGHELYASIKGKLRLYIHLPEPTYGLVAAWVIGTYFYCAFSAYPFLHCLGPKETGKTNLLCVLAQLCFNAVRTTYISAPALADTTDALRGTLLLDQADDLRQKP